MKQTTFANTGFELVTKRTRKHAFRVIKCQFGYRKTGYRGLVKNTVQLITLFALSNLWMVRKRILVANG